MKVEGVRTEKGIIGKGTLNIAVKDGNLIFEITAKPRPVRKREEQEEERLPMEGVKLSIPLDERNISSLFKMAVEGRDSLIKKAFGEREEIGFDEKLKAGEGSYIRFRGYPSAFRVLARSDNREGFLVLKPKEFYLIVHTAERIVSARNEYRMLVTRDLNMLLCQAEKGTGLSFISIQTGETLAKITDKATIVNLMHDLDDRVRIENMYPVRFGSIKLHRRFGSYFLDVNNRNYKTDRIGLLTLKLLCRIVLD